MLTIWITCFLYCFYFLKFGPLYFFLFSTLFNILLNIAFVLQDTGCLGLVHWGDLERECGEEGGRGVQDWGHAYTHGGFMLMCGKTNTVLQSKIT